MTCTTDQNLIQIAQHVIEIEARAIYNLKTCLSHSFIEACKLILNRTGKTIVMGIGKSGHIAKKIAATLASTGTPAFFVHPSEARHGDMGMITPNDVILLLSNSGETDEIVSLLPQLKLLSVPIISLTGRAQSTMASMATVNLTLPPEKEACPLGLAPTTSTTMMLVMGDAIAITLLQMRGLTAQDFARFHPGGTLGKQLTLRVNDKMHQGNAVPQVLGDTYLVDALLEMNRKRLGMTAIINTENTPIGIYTDGDLRRTLTDGINIHETLIRDVMTTQFKTTQADTLMFDALQQMETYKITTLLVVNQTNKLVGVIHLHDILGPS